MDESKTSSKLSVYQSIKNWSGRTLSFRRSLDVGKEKKRLPTVSYQSNLFDKLLLYSLFVIYIKNEQHLFTEFITIKSSVIRSANTSVLIADLYTNLVISASKSAAVGH